MSSDSEHYFSLDRLGFSPEKVKSINPDIIVCRFDAYGGPNNTGRKHNHIGYDNNVQAAVGITDWSVNFYY